MEFVEGWKCVLSGVRRYWNVSILGRWCGLNVYFCVRKFLYMLLVYFWSGFYVLGNYWYIYIFIIGEYWDKLMVVIGKVMLLCMSEVVVVVLVGVSFCYWKGVWLIKCVVMKWRIVGVVWVVGCCVILWIK